MNEVYKKLDGVLNDLRTVHGDIAESIFTEVQEALFHARSFEKQSEDKIKELSQEVIWKDEQIRDLNRLLENYRATYQAKEDELHREVDKLTRHIDYQDEKISEMSQLIVAQAKFIARQN